ncbi:MAG: phage portal protein [Planctomycetota bacterium]|nr:phage portal protein [Planctomycetota bacterium]
MINENEFSPLGPLDRLQQRLKESYGELWDSVVDPREALLDDDGSAWLPLATAGSGQMFETASNLNDAQLRDIRNQCRMLALCNEFAINGHENRISYIVGTGHTYRATVKKGASAPEQLVAAAQHELDAFLRESCWNRRQQEIVRRRDRDGEVFLRFFVTPDGQTRVRFVEPGQVAQPTERATDPNANLGILTDRHDVETVVGYYVDGALVDADEIQHRKANVDVNVRRGLPLFFPVRKNLRRAERLLRNMSTVAEIQSAIALIRRHKHGTRSALEQFASQQADMQSSSQSRRTQNYQRFAPGTIVDAHADVEYDFPTAGLDASNFVTVLQAELRAISSRLVMPEFMLTSDASNANYSSTMVAEGPAMRMFARLQTEQVHDDLAVMWRVVDGAIAAGRLPTEARHAIEIQATPPSLAVRDQLAETQRFQIEFENGILSKQTWSQRSGLDYDQEQQNMAAQAVARSDAVSV